MSATAARHQRRERRPAMAVRVDAHPIAAHDCAEEATLIENEYGRAWVCACCHKIVDTETSNAA